jgi:DNA-binding transcriptional LysR family regulator
VDLRQLATFRAIIDAGNFARAASRLGLGPSTVTLHIQGLEADLGGPLFIRQGRRLDLTELGDSVRRHADAIALHLDAIGEEAAELAAATRGTLRLGAIEPLAHLDLMPLLTTMARGRPAISVRLDVAGTALLSTSVAEGRLVFAVCSAPPRELDLIFEPLFREPIGALLPADHALAHAGDAVPAQRLAGEPVVASEPGCAYRARILEAFTAIGVDLDIRARSPADSLPSRQFEPASGSLFSHWPASTRPHTVRPRATSTGSISASTSGSCAPVLANPTARSRATSSRHSDGPPPTGELPRRTADPTARLIDPQPDSTSISWRRRSHALLAFFYFWRSIGST